MAHWNNKTLTLGYEHDLRVLPHDINMIFSLKYDWYFFFNLRIGCCGQCNHVGGLLFSINRFIAHGLHANQENISCTSKINGWIVPRNLAVKPKAISEIIRGWGKLNFEHFWMIFSIWLLWRLSTHFLKLRLTGAGAVFLEVCCWFCVEQGQIFEAFQWTTCTTSWRFYFLGSWYYCGRIGLSCRLIFRRAMIQFHIFLCSAQSFSQIQYRHLCHCNRKSTCRCIYHLVPFSVYSLLVF